MSASALTRRYAKALVELAVEQQAVDRYGEELATVNAVLDQEALLRQLLESPTLALEKKGCDPCQWHQQPHRPVGRAG